MAKVKKQEKSIEQRLEEALVFYEKTPYKLPSNWCWTRLGTVCKLDSGIKNDREELFYLDAKTLRTQNYEQTRRNGVVVEEGEKVILVDGENSGEVFDIPKRGYMGSTFRILNINELVNEVYVRYFISSHQDELRNNKIGSAIPHLNKELFFNLIFPLAPIEEQKRIVEIIEKQFAKLDEARDLIQASLDSFADRKSAILHKAFTGELIRIPYSISMKCLGEITDISSSKRIYKEEYVSQGVPFFRSTEIVDLYERGYTEPQYFISQEKYTQIKIKYGIPQEGDLLVTSVGTIGKTWIVDNREFYYKDGNLTQVKQCKELNMKFLQYYIDSSEFKLQVENVVAGSAYNALTIEKFKKIQIPYIKIDEQEEIVRILDSIFEKEDKSKELLDMLDKIDEMKKSILARAFRGQLGTSNPTDEPAIDLLRKIL